MENNYSKVIEFVFFVKQKKKNILSIENYKLILFIISNIVIWKKNKY